VILQRDGAPNSAITPSPVNLSIMPSNRVTQSAQRRVNSAITTRSRSGSSRLANNIEPTTSANNTDTCLRSPEATSSPPAAATFPATVAGTATAAPQAPQNRAPAERSTPHSGHGRGNPIPQPSQNRAPGRLS
jgi:hypothetical protein